MTKSRSKWSRRLGEGIFCEILLSHQTTLTHYFRIMPEVPKGHSRRRSAPQWRRPSACLRCALVILILSSCHNMVCAWSVPDISAWWGASAVDVDCVDKSADGVCHQPAAVWLAQVIFIFLPVSLFVYPSIFPVFSPSRTLARLPAHTHPVALSYCIPLSISLSPSLCKTTVSSKECAWLGAGEKHTFIRIYVHA